MFSDWIRRTAFWSLDAVRGGDIRKNYKEIKMLNENGILNKAQLKIILEHAVKNVKYYSNMDSNNFYSFPVINKNIIKEHWQELHAENYYGKPVHYMSTSGSTGTPFTMEWDMGKRRRQMAELIYFNELGGQKLGQKYAYFRVWTDKNRKSRRELWMQNLIPFNILHLDNDTLEGIRQRLKKRPYINSCLAYASTYEYLAKYLYTCGDKPEMFHVKTLFSGSEVLSMDSKKFIKSVLGCKVIDRYSNEENGFLAQSTDMSDEFIVNVSGFKIEILKQDCDEPAEIGEVGRVVVTDLYSMAVPLIRYDTGDLAIAASSKSGWTTVLKTIQGRRVDVIYDTQGGRLTGHTLSVYMWRFEKLKQYQFIQEDKDRYVVKVNGAEGIYTDNEIIDYLKPIFGQDAKITVEHVEGIPTLASGKFKKTICRYQPEK